MKKEMVGADALAGWPPFYKDFMGMKVDFSGVLIPKRREGFDRLLVIAQGLTSSQIFEAMQRKFTCWRYTNDLDEVTKGLNERDPTQHYAIRVRDCQEADKELRNLSANDIKERGITTETLLERLVHEAAFFARTGKHLDVDNVTLCSGSRDSSGDVPSVDWSGLFRGLSVYGCLPQRGRSGLRARAVVSF